MKFGARLPDTFQNRTSRRILKIGDHDASRYMLRRTATSIRVPASASGSHDHAHPPPAATHRQPYCAALKVRPSAASVGLKAAAADGTQMPAMLFQLAITITKLSVTKTTLDSFRFPNYRNK